MRTPHELNQLNEDQQRLVADNIGLVGHHLRTHVRDLRDPTRDREWDDLFQEGCLGLVQAAKTFDSEKGIAFSNFARRRIQSAVHRGLLRAFETVKTPEGELRSSGKNSRERRRVLSLDKDNTLPDRPSRADPRRSPNITTVRERLREKMDHALTEAARDEVQFTPRNQVSEKTINRLVEERLRIPRDDCRTSLRQISRDASRSYASIAYVERRIIQRTRQSLARDLEFDRLRSDARKKRDGLDAIIERQEPMQNIGFDFEKRWSHISAESRNVIAIKLIRATQPSLTQWACEIFDTLPQDKQKLIVNQLVEMESEATP